jgi:hypothetical protein
MMVEFISELAYQVLDLMSAVIVCGGFKHSNEKPNAVSTDVAALRGAERYAKEHKVNKVDKINLKDCYEAWIPDPGLDSREDVKGVVRMSEAEDGITVRVMTGRTPLGRRLAMVGDVDIVVTIYGRQHTEVVVERGLDLGLPVLPIPDAGGDSEALLRKYRPLIAKSFAPGELDRCLSKISDTIKDRPHLAARAVIKLIQSAKIGRCLVLLPFDEEHNSLYASTIEPAVTRHMIALRLDRLPSSEAIYTNFADAIQTSSAVIADITILNENVMYEIGYSHGRGLKPLIFTRNEARLTQLPVYFRTLNVRLASNSQPVDTLIEDDLCFVKNARRLNELSG